MTNYFQGPYCSGNGMATMVYQNAVNYGLPFYDTFAGNNTMFLQPMNASSLGWKTSMPYDQWQQKIQKNPRLLILMVTLLGLLCLLGLLRLLIRVIRVITIFNQGLLGLVWLLIRVIRVITVVNQGY